MVAPWFINDSFLLDLKYFDMRIGRLRTQIRKTHENEVTSTNQCISVYIRDKCNTIVEQDKKRA